MSSQAENNEQYLKRVLEWLRLLLVRRAEQLEQSVEPSNPLERDLNPLQSKLQFIINLPFQEQKERKQKLELRFLPSSGRVTGKQIEKAAKVLEEAEAVWPPPALIALSHRLGLSDFERATLLLCVAVELDTSIGGLCGRAQGNPNRPYPTFALAMGLFNDQHWDFLSSERPLRYWRLIEINQPATQPLLTSTLQADERIVHYAKGMRNSLDERLMRLVSRMNLEVKEELPSSQEQCAGSIVTVLKKPPEDKPFPIVQLLGNDGLSKQLVAQRVARLLNFALFRLSSEWLPDLAGELETFIRLWQRETRMWEVGLFIEAKGTPGEGRSIQRLLEQCEGRLFLDTPERWGELTRASLLSEIERPTPDEQEKIWNHTVGLYAPESPEELANQFNLNVPIIKQIAQVARRSGDADLKKQLWDGCRMHSRQRLDLLAQRIEVKADMADLVLPQHEKDLLDLIASQVHLRNAVYRQWRFRERMNRGLGLSVLFAGESGTGKTMAAEALANKLNLNLYKIDLSTVVSKYIGETEKNLRMLFDAAENGGVILFFDEADALFGKRSEVKDSHDRYANIEINYLLQRMESFKGLAILATNMKSALDTAFLRRLRFIVNFPFPGREERKQIWQKAFPDQPNCKKPDLDWDWLARLNLTGGNIQTIVLNTAFWAAKKNKPLDTQLVLDVARMEFIKLEKATNEADFQWKKRATV